MIVLISLPLISIIKISHYHSFRLNLPKALRNWKISVKALQLTINKPFFTKIGGNNAISKSGD